MKKHDTCFFSLCMFILFLGSSRTEVVPNTYYIPIKGCAYRLVLADVTGDGHKELIYGAYEGAVRCINPNTGKMLWEKMTGGFPFAVAAGDVDGDGKAETFAACADGKLYAFSPVGKLLWTFQQDNGALYSAGVSGKIILTGGMNRKVYAISASGQILDIYDLKRLVNNIAIASDHEFLVCSITPYGSSSLTASLKIENNKIVEVWNKSVDRNFVPFSLDAGDLDGDGKFDAVTGTRSFENRGNGSVLAMNGQGEVVWRITNQLMGPGGTDFNTRGYYTMTLVRIADVISKSAGPEVITSTSGCVALFDRLGKLLGEANSRLSFTDIVVDGSTLYLGSTSNGDNTIYRIDMNGDWEKAINTLERQGLAREVGENLTTLKQQAAAVPADPLASQYGPYGFTVKGYNEKSGMPAMLAWFTKNYQVPNFVAATQTDWMNATIAPDFFISVAKKIETDRVPIFLYMSHSSTPKVSLPTLVESMRVAPTQLLGFITHEDEQLEKLPDYLMNYIGPLADTCALNGKKIQFWEKNVWYFTMPALKQVFNALFQAKRNEVYVLGTDDANSRTPEISILTRVGLRQAGLASHIQACVNSDLFCYNRTREWEQPKSGSPFLRLLIAHTVLGADYYSLRMTGDRGGSGFSEQTRECMDSFLPMLIKGIIFSPKPEQMVGFSRIGFAVHEAPKNWLIDGYNGHNVDIWKVDAELDSAVLPHNGCIWGNTPTPPHALTSVLFHKQRQFGYFIPPTPYGPVIFVPAYADLSKVIGIDEWWHTDGVSVWREGGPKLTGTKAATALKESFEKAALKLPFRPVGDDVFFQTVEVKSGRYRIFMIDPGWLDPAMRRVNVHIQIPGEFTVRDLLSGKTIPAHDHRFSVVVPAGSLRILEAERMIK